ncbi:IS66 family insertion sequence element accessory protein TnpA [Engelhardtia mirabilis]|uniref:Transposase n=1 Tax=Engelhardtia mirabilis TaxID=2528011 RepID=A0A518BS89_9BACT|nr:hypothetical protein Pla133_49650 [Planctomycetes bacterium Pla133]QDV04168.1 hypothetical protein Pla86_49630 [Planctomycetes bacterium Pla86]
MTTGRARSRGGTDLAKYYRELLEEQAESELSMTEFAGEVGVSAATLYGWRRRLAASAQVEAGELVEVQVTDDEVGMRQRAPIVLTIDNRLRVELEAGFDAAALERLLRLLSRC